MTSFLYIGILSARNWRNTKGISRIESLRAYNPYSLWDRRKYKGHEVAKRYSITNNKPTSILWESGTLAEDKDAPI